MGQRKTPDKTFLRQRSLLTASLPPLDEIVRGSLFERKLRCGKQNCRCTRGNEHAAFYLSVSFAAGKTEQISLPADLVPIVRKWITNYQQILERLEQTSKINRQWIRAERTRLKQRNRLKK